MQSRRLATRLNGSDRRSRSLTLRYNRLLYFPPSAPKLPVLNHFSPGVCANDDFKSQKLILPGVGHFGHCLSQLSSAGYLPRPARAHRRWQALDGHLRRSAGALRGLRRRRDMSRFGPPPWQARPFRRLGQSCAAYRMEQRRVSHQRVDVRPATRLQVLLRALL